MSFVRVWIHLVFSTKDRYQYFNSEIRDELITHIKQNCRDKDIFLDAINGWSDHLHLLISLGREQNIAKIAMLIKGESAHWLNKNKTFHGRFSWQDDYYAISVSESQVDEVRKYIAKQVEHHKAVPFERELETLRKITGRKLG